MPLFRKKNTELREAVLKSLEDNGTATEKLLARLKSGDTQATNEVFSDNFGSLVHFLTTRGASIEDAEDVAQETLTKFFMNLEDYDTNFKIKTYLYTIAANKLIDLYRSGKAKNDVTDSLEAKRENHFGDKQEFDITDAALTPEEAMLKAERIKIVHDAISHLYGGTDMEVVVMERFINELKIREIVKKHGMKEGTVKARLHRAKAELTEFISLQLS